MSPRRLPASLIAEQAEIRIRLETYRQLAAELPELFRAARRLPEEARIPVAELARLAGVDRGRVHRAIRTGRDQDPQATRETAEELRHNVMTGAYAEAERTGSVPDNWLHEPTPIDYSDEPDPLP